MFRKLKSVVVFLKIVKYMYSHIFTFNYDLLQMFVEAVNIIESSIFCFRVSLNRRKIAC